MRYADLSASVILIFAGWSAAAVAHDGPPEPLSLHERGDDGDAGRVMGTSFGLVQSVNGSAWDIICAEAIGYTEQYEPVVHWSAGGTLFVGSPFDLFVSRDGGCNWSPHSAFAGRGASDVRGAPGQPNAVFATTSRFGKLNGLYRSDDDGFNWATLATRVDTQFTAVRFAPSNPMRAYASAWSLGSPGEALVYRSDDAGQSFTESVASAPWFSGFTLVAVSPLDTDMLFASVYDGGEYVLLSSSDAGATFTEVARDARAFRAIAFEPDSPVVWATANRLFRSDDGGKSFAKQPAPARPACVTRALGETELCGSSLDGFAIASLQLDGGITPTFTFDQSRGLLSCAPGSSVHDVCTPIWGAIAALLGVPVPDGGVPAIDGGADGGGAAEDAGSDGGAVGSVADGGGGGGGSPGGCGCAAGGGPTGAMGFGGLLLCAWAAARVTRALRGIRGLNDRTLLATIVATLALVLSACPPPPPAPPPDAGNVDACDPNPCIEAHRSVCTVDDAGAAACACDQGFHEAGGACVPSSGCDPNPCIEPHKSVCTLVGSAGVCGCDPDYVATPEGECVPSPEDCSAAHSSGDAFEPDECPTQARDIGGSGSQQEAHTIDPTDDVDWFRVDVAAGRIIRVQATPTGASPLRADAWMGEPLGPVGAPHGDATGVDAAWKAPVTGTFFFRVSGGAGASMPAAYSINLGDLGVDDTGDVPVDARAAAIGAEELGAVQFNSDVDVLSLPLVAGHSWRLELATTGEAPVTAQVLDGEGAPLRAMTTSDGTASIVTRSVTTGPLFIALSADPEVAIAPWSITATDLGVDDHGDRLEEATSIVAGGSAQSASLERAGDADVFTFSAIAGHIYAVTCTPQSFADCLVTLADPSGVTVAADLDGQVGRVVAELAVAGTYSVRIESTPGATGAYTYQLVDLGLDDHGDDPTTATVLGMPPIMGSSNGTGNIETPGDHDFLSFIADVDHIYRITCTRTSLGACNMRVFDVNGLPVAQDTDGADALTLHLYKGGGTFYVDLYGDGVGTGAFDWKIVDLFHDDHGDDLFTATSMLPNNAWVTGEIQTFTDPDWFKFAAAARHAYRITCQRVSLNDCLLTVEDAAENVLAQDTNGQDAEVVVKVLASADRYFRIATPAGSLGTYWVKVEDLGEDDCPESATGAPVMFVNGTPANGLFEYPGDVDFRVLALVANTTYTLTASGTPLQFTLYASDGVSVIASGSTPASFSDPSGGTRSLEVHALSPTATGAYSITVAP